jgi:stress response protein SCP2
MSAEQETAFVSGELYRRDGAWKFRAVGQGYSAGLAGLATDFGINTGDASAAADEPAPIPAPAAEPVAPSLPPPTWASVPDVPPPPPLAPTPPAPPPAPALDPTPPEPAATPAAAPAPSFDLPPEQPAPAAPPPPVYDPPPVAPPPAPTFDLPPAPAAPPPPVYDPPPVAPPPAPTFDLTEPAPPPVADIAPPQPQYQAPVTPDAYQPPATAPQYQPPVSPAPYQPPADAQPQPPPTPPADFQPPPPPAPTPPADFQPPAFVPPTPPAPLPAAPPTSLEAGAVSLRKDEHVALATSATGPLNRVMLGLGWQSTPGRAVDLDASVIAFDALGEKQAIVWYQHMSEFMGALQHTGDNQGEAGGDSAERVLVELNRLPPNVDSLVFTINSFKGQTFVDVTRAYCVLTDEYGREYVRFDLSDTQPSTAVLMSIIRRGADGAWTMRAIGEFHDCRTVRKLVYPASLQTKRR